MRTRQAPTAERREPGGGGGRHAPEVVTTSLSAGRDDCAMTDDDDWLDTGGLPIEQLVEFYARQRELRKKFTDAQLAALDALWRAERDGHVPRDAADRIEQLIRDGHVHGARKRLTLVRRNGQAAPTDRRNGTDASS